VECGAGNRDDGEAAGGNEGKIQKLSGRVGGENKKKSERVVIGSWGGGAVCVIISL